MASSPSLPAHAEPSPVRYDAFTRYLHWGMAVLFAWQLTSVTLRVTAEDSAIEGFFWSTHTTVGFLLFVLAFMRGAWGLATLGGRPPHRGTLNGRLVAAGHLALYVLMIAVPSLALLRAYGRGKGFSALGVQIMPATGETLPGLVALGNGFHGLLGWTLFTLIAGHIVMVAVHRYYWQDDRLSRMRGG